MAQKFNSPACVAGESLVAYAVPAEAQFAPSAIEFMGGARVFEKAPQTRADIHAAIVGGLPYSVLWNLLDAASVLSADDVAGVIGISSRTLRRQKDDLQKPMPADLGSKTWLFAETLAKASEVFGSRAAAERWMTQPAMGLDGSRPLALLATVQGTELVTEFLGRLEAGVYN